MDEFHRGRCNFQTAAEAFKLIEQDTKTIFISKESEAEELFQELKWFGASKARMRNRIPLAERESQKPAP